MDNLRDKQHNLLHRNFGQRIVPYICDPLQLSWHCDLPTISYQNYWGSLFSCSVASNGDMSLVNHGCDHYTHLRGEHNSLPNRIHEDHDDCLFYARARFQKSWQSVEKEVDCMAHRAQHRSICTKFHLILKGVIHILSIK